MTLRLAGGLTLLLASVASGQQPPALARLETGTCRTCSVVLELVATIGKATDAELIPDYGRLTSLSDGGFVVAAGRTTVPFLRYDRGGAFIGTLGKLGDGPGEYRWPQSVVRARGDSISIMGQRRVTTISTLSGRGRSETVPPGLDGFFHAVLADGSVIVNVSAQRQVAFALLTPGSSLKKQFGPAQPPLVLPRQNGRTIGDEYSNLAALAPSRIAGVWAVSQWYEHHLQRLSSEGAVLVDIRRHPAWFAPYTYADIDEKLYRLGELRAPRPPTIIGLGVDSIGHVFVVSRVADASWKKDPNAPPPPSPGVEYPVQKLEPTGGIDRYVDGILEVYDDKSGVLLGSWRSDSPLGWLTQNGLLYTQTQDADGITTLKVYRLRVVGAK
jgi:hypothetical protein